MSAADRALMLALAAESRDARMLLEALAARAGAWVVSVPEAARGEAVTDLQAFDALAQRLDVLAALLDGLGKGDAIDKLLAAVPLADMAARLGGSEVAPSAAAGELALFD